MALAGQGGVGGAESRSTGPSGSELWVSENGATNHVTSDPRNVYDWVEIPPGKEKVLIGRGKEMRVRGVGSLDLNMPAATDFNVKLIGVHVTGGIGFNTFSLHDAQSRQTITLDNDGVHLFHKQLTFSPCEKDVVRHLFNKQLTFPPSKAGSYLYATRFPPTPTSKTLFSAVAVSSGCELLPHPR